MKRYIILLILSSITFFSYGQTINELFKSMPSQYLPAFSEANKTMLLVDSSLSVIPYSLGQIERLEYTDTFLSLKTSEVGTMQIKILPLVNNTNIVVLIKTVCSNNVCDSDIRFFTNEWQEIQKSNILPAIPASMFSINLNQTLQRINGLCHKSISIHSNLALKMVVAICK